MPVEHFNDDVPELQRLPLVVCRHSPQGQAAPSRVLVMGSVQQLHDQRLGLVDAADWLEPDWVLLWRVGRRQSPAAAAARQAGMAVQRLLVLDAILCQGAVKPQRRSASVDIEVLQRAVCTRQITHSQPMAAVSVL